LRRQRGTAPGRRVAPYRELEPASFASFAGGESAKALLGKMDGDDAAAPNPARRPPPGSFASFAGGKSAKRRETSTVFGSQVVVVGERILLDHGGSVSYCSVHPPLRRAGKGEEPPE